MYPEEKEIIDFTNATDNVKIKTIKSKKKPGRKTGYSMDYWRKNLLSETSKNSKLERFNAMISEMTNILTTGISKEQKFYFKDDSEENFSKNPDDYIYEYAGMNGDGRIIYLKNAKYSWKRTSIIVSTVFERFVKAEFRPLDMERCLKMCSVISKHSKGRKYEKSDLYFKIAKNMEKNIIAGSDWRECFSE